jgi:hypothetical protein
MILMTSSEDKPDLSKWRASQAGRDWFEVYSVEQELKKLTYKVKRAKIGVKFLSELVVKAHREAEAVLQYLEACPVEQESDNWCDCEHTSEEHGPYGCKVWFGDRNTGDGCDCRFSVKKDKEDA